MIPFRICATEHGLEMLTVEKDPASFLNALEALCKHSPRNCIATVESWGDHSKPCSSEDHLHNLMFLSSEPDTITWSDGWASQLNTGFVCPLSFPTIWQEFSSHMYSWLSSDPDNTHLPFTVLRQLITQ